MPINKNQFFTELLNNFLKINENIEAIIVSDEDGLIIAGEKRKDIDMELISFLTAVVSPILERIRNEFAFQKFGTASFDTEDHRLLFISVDKSTTLSLVLGSMGSTDKLAPYAYFLAEKVAQILAAVEGDLIQLSIPNFEYEASLPEISSKLKNQIYQSKLDQGGMFSFKFIIIGDHEVGKTSIIRRFVENRFLTDYRATIGLNILSHNFYALGNRINLLLWDVGAQAFFQKYRKIYYRGSQAAFIVFDLTNRNSFESVNKWHNELKEFLENRDLPIIIVGNKKDLIEKRAISSEEGIKLAKDLSDVSKFSEPSALSNFSDLSYITKLSGSKISYIETSALTGENIQEAFNLICYHYIAKSKELEEKRIKNAILEDMNIIIEDKGLLTLSFINKDLMWSPGLQLITEIKKPNNFTKVKEKKKEKIIEYAEGLVLNNFNFEAFNVINSDGVFCIFDAREKDHVDPEWKKIVNDVVEKLKKNKVILIGVRISKNLDWSRLMEEFEIKEEAEEKSISILFFKISDEYRFEIFEQLEVMLNILKDLRFNY